MRLHLHRKAAAIALACLASLGLASCGLQPAATYIPPIQEGSLKKISGLPEGSTVTVAGKNFTEQLILAKISSIALKVSGFSVNEYSNVPGSQPVRQMSLDGTADFAWEYTGTAWLTYLGHPTGIPDQQEQWQAVHDADLKNGLTWLQPAKLNNTYAMAKVSSNPKLKDIKSISDLAKLPVNQRTFCVESEFNSRADGFTPMLEHYGLKRGSADGVPESNIRILDTGAVYSGVANGVCNFGEVFTTDGRIPALKLDVLKDDKQFFPGYNGTAVVNTKTLQKYPQIRDIFAQISPKLTDEVMQKLNAQVDLEGRDPVDVATDWMVSEGLVKRP